jgi:predicted AlkP superfamily phosphohydrolase/phosphomutase
MFWRFREPEHPANRGQPPDPEMARVIEEYYQRCDQVVGEALEYADPESLVMVLSDHGFTSFQRQVNLNTWLHGEGYLALRSGVEPGEAAGDLFGQVDWSRTRAYALGLAGVYLNLEGREAEGTVAAADAPDLRREIAGRLTGLRDPVRRAAAIINARVRDQVYRGPYVEKAPDILVGFAPGYRVSSDSAMGGVAEEPIADNLRPWSGDHVVEPTAVPGVLFMNVPFRGDGAALSDLAPTILDAFGVPDTAGLEGRSLLS